MGSLRDDGPATATMLAERLGESSGLTSYHVRILAEHGFVEEATERGKGRERWWRAAQDMTSWWPEDFRGDPDAEQAEQWLTGYHGRRGMEWLDEWLQRRPKADPDWVAASDASDYSLDLTSAELRALMNEVSEVVLRHREAARSSPPADDGVRQKVRVLVYAFPRPPEEQQHDGEADDG